MKRSVFGALAIAALLTTLSCGADESARYLGTMRRQVSAQISGFAPVQCTITGNAEITVHADGAITGTSLTMVVAEWTVDGVPMPCQQVQDEPHVITGARSGGAVSISVANFNGALAGTDSGVTITAQGTLTAQNNDELRGAPISWSDQFQLTANKQ